MEFFKQAASLEDLELEKELESLNELPSQFDMKNSDKNQSQYENIQIECTLFNESSSMQEMNDLKELESLFN